MNKFTHLLLLVVMFFSITHELVFDGHEESHCSVQEYVAEFSAPIHHDQLDEHEHENDFCDSHFMFHISFLLPQNFSLFEISQSNIIFQSTFLPYPFLNTENSFRPPITS